AHGPGEARQGPRPGDPRGIGGAPGPVPARCRPRALCPCAADRRPCYAASSLNAGDQEIRAAFAEVDKDGNGAIDLLEFRALMAILAGERSPAEVEADFDAIDSSGEGMISFDDFARWWGARPEANI